MANTTQKRGKKANTCNSITYNTGSTEEVGQVSAIRISGNRVTVDSIDFYLCYNTLFATKGFIHVY
jgi:hypothetical protein